MTTIPFTTLDVFTVEPFKGNPLAVILDGRALTSLQMQAIAAEFGYSETTFVLPPKDAANTAEVRIFTPVAEIPFAGHPNVGTAIALAKQGELFGKPLTDELRFEEKAGLVNVRLTRDDTQHLIATIRAPQALSVSGALPTSQIAKAMSLQTDDIVVANHKPSFVSVGLKFIAVEVAGLDALGRARPSLDALAQLVKAHETEQTDGATFLYCRVGDDHIRARMFSPFDNVPEDPATGSASAALGAYLTQLSPVQSMTRTILVEQGVEMGRRSLITITAEKRDGQIASVDISGQAVAVMQGTITV
ncbi:PhzF family phenazine biosynthesis protein [Allorhizobium terrae]|uniref:PhzF family phenazine biosynthesis protein n=1 Tax=Allorhizobium terrae TaxID=1848972 RepID=A0A4S4A6G5_9HYPH|nr:PhzF family phenazine biosynthesis protein [Allorhizobium terrae]THF53566.1 PhzF family phenazine biosynthesis protein [Allorhizobium terrae]